MNSTGFMSRASFRAALRIADIFLSFTSVSLYGQILVGRISGAVTDPTGAAVAGSQVTITNTDTQAARRVSTDNKGFYSVTELPIGPYKVEVNQSGFKRSSQSGLTLSADGRLTANFTLQVGEISQSVVVEARPEQLNTTSGEVAHVVDQRQVNNLPLNGRSYMELLTLVPGVAVTNPDQFSVNTSLSATNQVVNGHRSNQNNITVDGVGNLDNGSNGSLINNISPDFMQEVKIQTSKFSAFQRHGKSQYQRVRPGRRPARQLQFLHGSAIRSYRLLALYRAVRLYRRYLEGLAETEPQFGPPL
jgi:hypothetical protein